MKKNMKTGIIAGLAIVLLAVVIVGIGRSVATKEGSTLKNQKQKGLSFENASIEYKDKLSTFTVDVYNETDKTVNVKKIDITLKNKDNDSITLNYELGNLQADEGRKIIIDNIDYDLTGYTNITYKIHK